MKLNKKNKGFTLIELLVVISIIGILMSIILISFSDTKKDARNARRETDIKQIGTALELYYTDNEEYIISADNLCNNDSIGKAMLSVPEDPLSNPTTQKCYTWVDNTNVACAGKFCIYAILERGVGYLAASHKGVKLLDTAPATGFCECW